jgi:hypothetical protein
LFLLNHNGLSLLNRGAIPDSWSCNIVRTASTTLAGSGVQSGDLPSVSTTACCMGLSGASEDAGGTGGVDIVWQQ